MAKVSEKKKKMAGKMGSRWTVTTEKDSGATRYGVYHQDKGHMKVMGLGKEGRDRAKKFISKN